MDIALLPLFSVQLVVVLSPDCVGYADDAPLEYRDCVGYCEPQVDGC